MKHRLITFGRIVKAGAQNFVRNATLAIAAIAAQILALMPSPLLGQTAHDDRGERRFRP